MKHLPVHLAVEALMAGAVQFRWMYPIERYFSTLNKYVCNRARAERSISKGYPTEECPNFCSRYLNKNYDVELLRLVQIVLYLVKRFSLTGFLGLKHIVTYSTT
ncbi:hypothetical protein ACH5RR_027409 [Cinchona calisaya]|uniref:DUF4218 domain-containing protein n=1 Tax=Cinchona calisaya TaxID=153742 RepID=A0ABD2Z5C8_9GENT